MENRISKLVLNNVVNFFIALFLVIEGETIWLWQVSSGNTYRNVVYLLTCFFLFLVIILFYRNMIRFRKGMLIVFVAFNAVGFILILINMEKNLQSTIMFYIMIVLMMLYQNSIKRMNLVYDILKWYVSIITTLAVLSLFFWVFGSIFDVIHSNQTILVYRNTYTYNVNGYYNLYFEGQFDETFGLGIPRNTGVFYEAPKYALNLAIALASEIFLFNHKITKNAFILMITLVSTFSLTGEFFVMGVLIMYLYCYAPKSFLSKLVKPLMFLVFLIVTFFVVKYLLVIKSSTNSYSDRLDDFIAGFKAWKDNVFFGSGFKDMTIIHKYMSSFRKNNLGYSNSLFRVLAQGGVLLISVYIVPISVLLRKAIRDRNKEYTSFVILFIFLFVTTSFPYNAITIYLLSLMLRIWNEKNVIMYN